MFTKLSIAILLLVATISQANAEMTNIETLKFASNISKLSGECDTYTKILSFQLNNKSLGGAQFLALFFLAEARAYELPDLGALMKQCEQIDKTYSTISRGWE